MTDPTPQTPPTITPTPPPPVYHPSPLPKHPRRSFSIWRLFFGVVIVLFGLQLLANNYGWEWAWVINIWQLWPVLIILAGLSLLTRGHAISNWVGGTFAVLIIAGAVFLAVGNSGTVSTHVTTTDIKVAKEATATEAEYTFDLGAAKVRLNGGASDAVNGSFSSNVSDLETTSVVSGPAQQISVTQKSRSNRWWIFPSMKNELTATLNNDLPARLTIDSGASDLDLDLRTVAIKRLDLKSGASTVDLKLGDTVADSTVDISSGASTVTVSLPKTVGVKLSVDGGASTRHLPSEFKEVSKNRYESEGYTAATKKVSLTISAGASTITVRWE